MSVRTNRSRTFSSSKSHRIKVVGDAGSGKSSLIHSYVTGCFTDSLRRGSTDLQYKEVIIDGACNEIQIWDMIETYIGVETITAQYLRKSDGVIICCSATDKNYLESGKAWLSLVAKYAMEGVPCFVVMTKIDKFERKENWAVEFRKTEYGSLISAFFETSAKENKGISEMFERMTRHCVKFRDISQIDYVYIGSRRVSSCVSNEVYFLEQKPSFCCLK